MNPQLKVSSSLPVQDLTLDLTRGWRCLGIDYILIAGVIIAAIVLPARRNGYRDCIPSFEQDGRAFASIECRPPKIENGNEIL